ncbi:MAG: serine hydrolase domain-containing protein, partial [Gemmatimonadales bacterium]
MSMLRRFSSLALLGLLTLTSAAAAQRAVTRAPLEGFDQYVTNAIRELEHAGIAIAVVKNDSIVYAKGFGVREIGKPAPVDANTIFAIGSSTKAFAGLSVAMMVDEGKMSWDEPVATYLPGFRLYDPYVSQEITMRDALTHRSGLARTDLVWISGQFSSEELIRRLRFVKPAGPFRQQYGYQNLMYLAAGMAVAKVAGTPTWSDFAAQRILAPLGMRESSMSVRDLAGKTNLALPHARINDTLRTVAARDIDNVAPAGSINSNVLDMAQW